MAASLVMSLIAALIVATATPAASVEDESRLHLSGRETARLAALHDATVTYSTADPSKEDQPDPSGFNRAGCLYAQSFFVALEQTTCFVSLVDFLVPAEVTGATITSAYLHLSPAATVPNPTTSLYLAAVASAYDPNTVTWNTQPWLRTSTKRYLPAPTTTEPLTVNVTDIVRGWADGSIPALGFVMGEDLIQHPGQIHFSAAYFHSRETANVASQVPQLTISYRQPEPPGPPEPPEPPEPPTTSVTCAGQRATIVGTNRSDVLVGTPGPDVIAGLGGNDRIWGGGGDDVICGHGGNDRVLGQDGDDRLLGHGGNDVLNGGKGADTIRAGAGADRVGGGPGKDNVRLGGGDDTARGHGGVDQIQGQAGDDVIFGGRGSDILRGSAGNDSLSGEGGRDRLVGHAGTDRCDGGPGRDRAKTCEATVSVP